MNRSLIKHILMMCTLICSPAKANEQPFGLWLQQFREEAEAKGIPPALTDRALFDVAPSERVIELDRKQPESTQTFEQYLAKVVTPQRIEKARLLYAENRGVLEDIGKAYGVQPQYIVALWGIESNFGENMGDFSIIQALATLAYDGRRSDYFRAELFNALKILQDGHIQPEEMIGSWAGAMGQCQFMPTSFLRYAVDYDQDGKKDIWANDMDVFASVANYLSTEGWNVSEPWGVKVKLPEGYDDSATDVKLKKTQNEWKAEGITLESGAPLPASDKPAAMISGNREGGGPHYLIYGNYDVILKWNRSRYFGTAVGLLADHIAKDS